MGRKQASVDCRHRERSGRKEERLYEASTIPLCKVCTWANHLHLIEDTFHPRHVILATGASGKPSMPSIPGIENFKGDRIVHSSQFPGFSPDVIGKGKNAVIGKDHLFKYSPTMTPADTYPFDKSAVAILVMTLLRIIMSTGTVSLWSSGVARSSLVVKRSWTWFWEACTVKVAYVSLYPRFPLSLIETINVYHTLPSSELLYPVCPVSVSYAEDI